MLSHSSPIRVRRPVNRWVLRLAFSWAAAATCGSAADLDEQIQPLIRDYQGQAAVAIKHLPSGESYSYRADETMPTASLIKFPVMVEAYRQAEEGRLDLDQMLMLREEDKVPGSGVLTDHFTAGVQLRLRDAIRLMIAFSDNTATNLVLDQIGLASTTSTMEQLGLVETRLNAKVFRGDTSIAPERSRLYGLGSTTAGEMIRLYELLHRGELVSPQASAAMLEHLFACQDETKLRRLLPEATRVAHKSGAVSRSRCDAGLIFAPNGPIAVCVLTSENQDRRFSDDNAAHQLCGELAKIAFDYFTAPSAEPDTAAPSVLREGSSGRLVEHLQRTLNARLATDLAIDGDFGPLTQGAVIQFQNQQGLPASGVVDQQTWNALGPLVTKDDPVPPPDTINHEVLETSPPDELDGPPLVTCKAWAIADRSNGQLLWSEQADQPLDIASTTKIMTAYVVLRLAAAEPGLLNELLTFSERADQTIGSTAGIEAGEQLSVHEVLFGLLLPSGNDAAVALAEHFGTRLWLPPGGESEGTDPLELFVRQMNRAAAELGMENTTFKNPHGLTEPGHQATASDLVRLAHAAWQMESFRSYVATRQRGATVVGTGGYQRHVKWENTNQLLAIEGYQGIKTGTTSAAGACLVSTAQREDRALLMVVLGSASSPSRYVDSRNLYRWAWRQSLRAAE